MTKIRVDIQHEEPENLNSKAEVIKFLTDKWGSPEIVSSGKKVDASSLPRVIARDRDGKFVGLATYMISKQCAECELISIDATIQEQGIGSLLLKAVEEAARKERCRKIWLITTNDNPEAAAFYVKRGYRLVAICLDALAESRKLKPLIPQIGKHGIPLLDEWRFEKQLTR